ncbi:MAG: DNA-binding protein [Clostridia bacterium]|nr:DNA-binding protein [Clostridia bacterium]MBC7346095.1 DNA-binding protein [Clostridia bacterium]
MLFTGSVKQISLVRLARGEDLWEALQRLARERGVRCGWVQFIGAVERAIISYYQQEERRYARLELLRPLEIAAGQGNVSLKEGVPFVHAHLCLADAAGRVFGGHLEPGTVVFAVEVLLQEVETASAPVRSYDAETGLFLWPPLLDKDGRLC